MNNPPKCPYCGRYWHIQSTNNKFYALHKCPMQKDKQWVLFLKQCEKEDDLFAALAKHERDNPQEAMHNN